MPDPGSGVPSPSTLHDILVEARDAGFLGPGPIEPHLRHAEGFTRVARDLLSPQTSSPRLLDLGSGGGLPGLVVAARWPEAHLVLLDANARRTDFLDRIVRACGLESRVSVLHQRAELGGRDPAYRGTFEGVLVRSFGAPAVVAECGAPFLRPGGWLIVSEPPDAAGPPGPSELPERPDPPGPTAPPPSRGDGTAERWPARPLAQLGLQPAELVRREFGYQVLHQVTACPEEFPRRDGVPAKRPLF